MGYKRAEWRSGLTYKQVCDQCNTLVVYQDDKLDFRPWYADGFVYCPVCKNTSANELFNNWKVGEASCRFMAMTMDCKKGVKEKYRGGVHVDNTARAQFIYENDEFTR